MKTYTTDALPNLLTAFLHDYSRVYRVALVDAVNCRLEGEKDKAKLNTFLQQSHGINKRHANSAIAAADGTIKSAKESRVLHIKQLEDKLKSAKSWLHKTSKKLKNAHKFYAKKNWQSSKTGCQFPLSCFLDSKETNWQSLRFRLHHKKRYILHLERKIKALRTTPIRVSVSKDNDAYFVGSKDERFGNQVCQHDCVGLRIRVPACLEEKYGSYIECPLPPLPYGQDKLEQAIAENQGGNGLALSYRFYVKDFRWFMAVSFDLPRPKRVNLSRQWGCIGVDLNAQSIDWSYVDQDGNLKTHGQLLMQLSGKRRGQAKAIIADIVNHLAILATIYQCPIVCESLDFSRKKSELKERGRKYARMLSSFAYSKFFEALSNRCLNLGIELIRVNPSYSSLIGLVKYCRMYGLSSGEAAAIVIARRAMRFSERLPGSVTALLGVNPHRHVWSQWAQLNNKLRGIRRHSYYSISNWESMLSLVDESASVDRFTGKQ